MLPTQHGPPIHTTIDETASLDEAMHDDAPKLIEQPMAIATA